MKTETYLIKHEYDQNKKEMISKPCKIEMRWKIYDSFACLEILGIEKDRETIKHLLYCHKEQDLTIMPTVNEQVEFADDIESVNKDRVSIDRGHDIISANDLDFKHDKSKIKGFKIFTDDTDENKVLVGNSIETALEILENNGYIIELEKEEPTYTLGLHGQLDLEDLIATKKGQN